MASKNRALVLEKLSLNIEAPRTSNALGTSILSLENAAYPTFMLRNSLVGVGNAVMVHCADEKDVYWESVYNFYAYEIRPS